jgi:hypothetical protein
MVSFDAAAWVTVNGLEESAWTPGRVAEMLTTYALVLGKATRLKLGKLTTPFDAVAVFPVRVVTVPVAVVTAALRVAVLLFVTKFP